MHLIWPSLHNHRKLIAGSGRRSSAGHRYSRPTSPCRLQRVPCRRIDIHSTSIFCRGSTQAWVGLPCSGGWKRQSGQGGSRARRRSRPEEPCGSYVGKAPADTREGSQVIYFCRWHTMHAVQIPLHLHCLVDCLWSRASFMM